jgi:hypothetical protein
MEKKKVRLYDPQKKNIGALDSSTDGRSLDGTPFKVWQHLRFRLIPTFVSQGRHYNFCSVVDQCKENDFGQFFHGQGDCMIYTFPLLWLNSFF